jgi:hypothetical protein
MSSVNIFLFLVSKKSPNKIAGDEFLADVITIIKYILSLDQMGLILVTVLWSLVYTTTKCMYRYHWSLKSSK